MTGAKDAIEARTGTAGPRLMALLRMDDDQPITIEALVVVLVDAVHSDGEARELSDRDVYKAAKRRYRRLGTVSLPSGPIGGHVVSLYCEAATLCDIVELRAAPLSDEEIAAHLLVLWGAMPDTTSATAAIDGTGLSVLASLALRARDRVGLPASGPMTKRAVITTLWRLRDAVSSVRDVETPGVRESLFPGSAREGVHRRGARAARRGGRVTVLTARRASCRAVGCVESCARSDTHSTHHPGARG